MKAKNKEEMFGPNWWAMPLAARYASIKAADAGLTVTVECVERSGDRKLCIVWRGSEGQFRATKYFSKKPYSFPKWERWHSPGELRGYIYRDGPDQFRYVIEWCYEISAIAASRHAKQALQDQDYLRFRETLIEALPETDSGGCDG